MSGLRLPGRARVVKGVQAVALIYAIALLTCLLLVGWLYALLLAESWGVPAWTVVVVAVVAALAVSWILGRTAGLIRMLVAMALGGLWGVCLAAGSGSPTLVYGTGAVWAVGMVFLPNLAVKRYERASGRRAARSA